VIIQTLLHPRYRSSASFTISYFSRALPASSVSQSIPPIFSQASNRVSRSQLCIRKWIRPQRMLCRLRLLRRVKTCQSFYHYLCDSVIAMILAPQKWIICAAFSGCYRYVPFHSRFIIDIERSWIPLSLFLFVFFSLLSFLFYLACTIRKRRKSGLLSKTYLLYIQIDENCYALLALTTNIVTLPVSWLHYYYYY